LQLVTKRFPDVPVFGISARDGIGFDQFVEAAAAEPKKRNKMMEMDYKTYAEGEAELGWLNCQTRAQSKAKFDLDDLVLKLVQGIGAELKDAGLEVAHLKVLGQTLNDAAVANLVGSAVDSELSLASEIKTQAADLLVNARVAASPDELESIVNSVTSGLADQLEIELKVGSMQSFRPGKPEPTHRAE